MRKPSAYHARRLVRLIWIVQPRAVGKPLIQA